MPSNYHLPYRGLPPEVRIMIWRLCLQKNVEVIGGEVYWTPDYLEDRNLPLVDWSTCAIEHGVDYWDSEIRPFRFLGAPNLSILRLNRELHRETYDVMQHAVSFDLRHLSKNATWNFLRWLQDPNCDSRYWPVKLKTQGISRNIIHEICLAIALEEPEWRRMQGSPECLCWDLLSFLPGVPYIVIEVNISDYYERVFDQSALHDSIIMENATGYDNIDWPSLIEEFRGVIVHIWDEWCAEKVPAMILAETLKKLDIAFVGIPDVMKHTIRDDGLELLGLDELCADCRASLQLEAEAYERPHAIRITMTKRDKAQVKD